MKRVKLIRLERIMGIEELEIVPGKGVTVIEGGNGVGKTSVLEGIRSALGSGYDATLVRHGHDESRAVIVFDDEVQVEKLVRATGGGEINLRHPDFGDMKQPRSYLAGAIDGLGLNPVTFLTAKDRVDQLLQALPMSVTREQLLEVVEDEEILEGIDTDQHALSVIDRVSKRVYDERTGVNRLGKDRQATVEQLRESLASTTGDEEDLEDQIAAAKREKAELDSSLSIQVNQIERKAARDVEVELAGRDARVKELQDEIERVRQASAANVEDIRARASRARQDVQANRQPQLAELDREISKLEERARNAQQVRKTRAVLQEAEAAAEGYHQRSQALTQTLARLGGLKLRLEQSLPIDGVTVRDGELHVDGVPWPRVNLERQVRVAVAVAKLRAGDIPLVCVDQLECLEPKVFDLFLQELAAAGLQPIVTRVTEGPLLIRNVEAGEVGS